MAEDPDELVCNFDTGQSTMEVTTVLLVGWAIFCVLLVALGRYVNRRFLQPPGDDVKKTKPTPAPPAATQNATTEAQGTDAATAAKVKSTDSVQLQAKPKSKTSKKKPVLPPGVTKGAVFPAPLPSPGGGLVTLRDATAPFATGSDKDAVNWVNDLLQWLYTDPTPTPYLQSTWIKTLNAITGKLENESGVKVQIQEIAPNSALPLMVNVMADPGPNDNNINILSDIESQELAFIVQVTRQTGDNFWSTEYTCHVDALSGPLSVACNTDTMTGTVHFDCKPKIALRLATNPRSEMDDPVDEHALQAVVGEILSNSVTNAAPEMDVNKFPRCPRFIRKQMFAERVIPVHYDSMIPVITPKKISKRGKRLFVKIIKANQIGSEKGCTAPICTVELDEPTHKHSTAVNEGISPFWDEQFLFDLNNSSSELLFEVWDKSQQVNKDRFLGLGIISVDDLLRNPSQRQIIPLQSRPYEGDDISGSLTVEFLCMEAVDVPPPAKEKPIEPSKVVEKEKPQRPPPPSPTKIPDIQNVPETISVPVAPKRQHVQHAPAIVVNGEDTVTSTALRELSKPHSPTDTAKSTLIIHSVQRPSDNSGPVQEKPATPVVTEPTSLPQDTGDRSRSKERKSFMSTLKKRLSFRGKRSRSVDQQQSSSSRDSSASRSTSVDRARSVPGSHGDNTSVRSSLSEMSGFSGSSAQTYIDEASMLVIEAIENGITKHYLIPGALASNRKWRKKGTKLHIFNDHTFVAKHLPSNITCQVCAKGFVRRIGKQGYECRDCQLKCHKPCHVRTDTHCPASSVGTMELIRDWWVDMPMPPAVEKKLSLKNKFKRLSHGLQPIPSNDTLPTNAQEASKVNNQKHSTTNNYANAKY